ncbi:hypothetical protein P692DRAFT_20738360 [Suillus brevipes Sb2]|nr:hypothetical protein P692DRAFT_20738360 [Suillus brevipes Sb2]
MDYMLCLPHRKILQGQSSTGQRNTSQFTWLLSDNTLLLDRLIDLMVQVMNLQTHASDKCVMILDTELPDSIRRNKMDLNKFHSLTHTLQGWKDLLYFPLCIPELSHFVVFNINFKLLSFCYSDSLNLPASKWSPFIVKLQQWLQLHFGRTFKNHGNTLPHSMQKDNVSCGLFAMNMIAHGIFLDPLGIDNPASTQAWWFNRITGPYTTAPLPPLPSSMPMTAPPPPPLTQSHSLLMAQTEEVIEEKE